MTDDIQHVSEDAESLLEDLADQLEVPESRYQAAERSYKSLGDWLKRPESTLSAHDCTVFPQGSFRLGTVIKPADDSEHYDLDVVCEIEIRKTDISQEQLKTLLGAELKAYAKRYNMSAPDDCRRCWTMNYADGAQFHMDVLPALPDGSRQRLLLEASGLDSRFSSMALAITDKTHPSYRQITRDWPASNPKGYSDWFRSQMAEMFKARRESMRLVEAKTSVEEIPEFRVRTSLQAAIKILKRHRDVRYDGDPEHRPISIILTTLAARSYGQEVRIADALYGILQRMDHYIERRGQVDWVSNPTDGRENFADKWVTYPERREAFYEWLTAAREDFSAIRGLTSKDELVDMLAPRMGRSLVEAAANRRQPKTLLEKAKVGVKAAQQSLTRLFQAPHREPLKWPALRRGEVEIVSVSVKRVGRPFAVRSDGYPLPKGCELTFKAKTNIGSPFEVYWQVVNSGREATAAGDLRGGFYDGRIEAGHLTRRETTRYRGSHSIECFIVKDGYCAARSGPFIVNIG